jgi:hypothetical protein
MERLYLLMQTITQRLCQATGKVLDAQVLFLFLVCLAS